MAPAARERPGTRAIRATSRAPKHHDCTVRPPESAGSLSVDSGWERRMVLAGVIFLLASWLLSNLPVVFLLLVARTIT